MINTSASSAVLQDTPALKLITGLFGVILGAAVILTLMILLLADNVFLAISNYLQIITAIAGSLVFLYFWCRSGGQENFLYLAGGFGLWGIANIAWYVNVLMGQRSLVFPSLIDIGMIASFLVMSIAFQKGLPKKQVAPHILLGLLIVCLLIPVGVIITTGISLASLVTLLYFFACGSFIIIGLNHSLTAYPANTCRIASLCLCVHDLSAPGDVPYTEPALVDHRHVRISRLRSLGNRVVIGP